MEWTQVILDWVNSLCLCEDLMNSISQLGDGQFFCEVLQLIFRKKVNVKDKPRIFSALKKCLNNLYTPDEWIDFDQALKGKEEELMKIVTVLVGVSSLQSEETIFLENPANFLPVETQIYLKRFLECVLANDNVVDASFVPDGTGEEDKENATVTTTPRRTKQHCVNLSPIPKVIFPGNSGLKQSPSGPESPPSTPPRSVLVSPEMSPLRQLLSSPVMEADRLLMPEKINEISVLRNRIEVLTACQRDLEDDNNSFKEENAKLNARCRDLERENHSLRPSNFNKTFCVGSPSKPKSPERSQNLVETLQERLKRSEEDVELLHSKLDGCDEEINHLKEELNLAIGRLEIATEKQEEILEEFAKLQQEKEIYVGELEMRDELIKKLKQEIEDYRDCQSTNSSTDDTVGLSGILDLSFCDSFDASAMSKENSICEDMASAVIEVQLREIQSKLDDTTTELNIVTQEKEELQSELFQKILAFETTLAEKEDDISQLRTSLSKQEEDASNLRQQLNEVTSTLNTVVTDLSIVTKENDDELQSALSERIVAFNKEYSMSADASAYLPLVEYDYELRIVAVEASPNERNANKASSGSAYSFLKLVLVIFLLMFLMYSVLNMPVELPLIFLATLFGRVEFSAIEKYGTLEHLSPPPI